MEDNTELIGNLGRISFFLIVLLAVFLLTVKSKLRVSNFLLAAMLLVMAFDFLGFFMWDFMTQYPTLVSFKMASSLLQMPLFYLYVLSICYSDFGFKKWHVLHMVPFVVFVLLFELSAISEIILRVYEVVGELQWLFYITIVFMALKKHRDVYRENYARPDSKIFKWLFQFAVFSCVGHAIVFAKTWFSVPPDLLGIMVNMDVVIGVFVLLIMTWFVFKALHAPELFSGIKTSLRPIGPPSKRKRDGDLDPAAIQEQMGKVQDYMESEKPYRDYELSLEKLALQLDMQEKDLSVLINHRLGKHFFDFVNTYRIKEAKSILVNPELSDKTILEVLYQVGFNSKSSFYTAFKKEVGKTPTQFRREWSKDKIS